MLKSKEICVKECVGLKSEALNNLENENRTLITYKKIHQRAIIGIEAFGQLSQQVLECQGDKLAACSMLFQQGSSQRHREAVIALHMHMHGHLLYSASPLAFRNRQRTIKKLLKNHRNNTKIKLEGYQQLKQLLKPVSL